MTAAVSSFSPSAPVPLSASAAAPAPSQEGFAQMLKARQVEPSEPPQKPTESPKNEASRSSSSPHANRATARQPVRQPAETSRAAENSTRKVDDTESASNPKSTDLAVDNATPLADPALVGWMVNLNLQVEAGAVPCVPRGLPGAEGAALPGEVDTAGAAFSEVGSDDKGSRLKPGLRHAPVQAGDDKTNALGEPRHALPFGRETIESGGEALQQEAAKAAIDVSVRPQEGIRLEASLALASVGAGFAVAGRPAETPPPVTIAMPTPADSPEFPQALGAQLSVLAREGVQQAELHLNPADMGPISVQIELNGSQAHVNFGADSAATRDIIESGLPELAAALRDAGFTLSGGGVHQQSQQGQREGDADGRRRGGQGQRGDHPATAEVATQPQTHVRVSAGGVDLYA